MKQYLTSSVLHISFMLMCIGTTAQIPAGYYDAVDGSSKDSLHTVLNRIISVTLSADYDGFSAQYWGENYFARTDWNPAGYFWDMYSNEQRPTYNSSIMAREHCMPRSWWGSSSNYGVANSDLHNLYPSDDIANGKKSNNPPGMVFGDGIWNNGIFKIGANIFSSDFTGTCYEPDDEYKGDFARTYMYMVTCYRDYADRWKDVGSVFLDNNTYPVFKQWAIDMLMEWCRQDPVSQKEINRNDSVFRIQQNRNPFIDIPLLYEYIWGDSIDKVLNWNKTSVPGFITPTNGTNINFGGIQAYKTRTRTLPLKTIAMSGIVSAEIINDASGVFSISNSAIDAIQTNSDGGEKLTISFSPTNAGSFSANLKITNSSIGDVITLPLTGNAFAGVWVDPVVPENDEDVILFYTGPWEKTSLPSSFSTNAASGPYSNGDFSFRKNNEHLIITFNEEASYMQFAIYPRNSWGANVNHLYVYEGTSSSSISSTAIADYDNSFVTVESYNNTPKIYLKSSTRAVKILYSKVAQNVGINNLIIMRKPVESSTHELKVSKIHVHYENGQNIVTGIDVGNKIAVYDIYGRLIYTCLSSGEKNVLPIMETGVYIVRSNNGNVKFVVR